MTVVVNQLQHDLRASSSYDNPKHILVSKFLVCEGVACDTQP